MSTEAAEPAPPPTTPAAAKNVASLQLSLPRMLDLALGTPEVGAVNLNLLHNFLHVLLHEIHLQTTKVEYRGDDANRIKTLVSSIQPGPSLYLQEYSIIDESNNERQRDQTTPDVEMRVDVITEDAPTQKSRGAQQTVGPGTEGEYKTVIFVEPIVDGATPTALGFRRLEQTVNELQQRFQALEELANTPELVERLKGKLTDPMTDVWQIISITKRLDATEEGIDKLTKVVQDVIKGETAITVEGTSTNVEERLTNLENTLSNLDQLVRNLELFASQEEDEAGEIVGELNVEEQEQLPANRLSINQLLGGIDVKEMHNDVATLQKEVAQMRDDLKSLNEKTASVGVTGKAQTTAQESVHAEQEQHAENELNDRTQSTTGTEHVAHQVETTGSVQVQETGAAVSTDTDQAGQAEKLKTPAEWIETIDAIGTELQIMKERLLKVEKDVTCFHQKLETAPTAGTSGHIDLEDVVSKIQEIQNEMEKLNQTADRLTDDRENRELHLNALLEQVELLKAIKADREDLEDALADKADAQIINRKVSYDQFDAACDDLAQGLEEAISKLGKQETIWQDALEEVQKEIEGKVDKIEISPLKDFVNHRLKTLQEKLKQVADARQENEAAGTKKMLRDVQCISCDKEVIMKMEAPPKFKVDTLPCTMSMKPYLTYELDQVRKQHRRLPHSRNMIQFEAAIQEEARKQKGAKADTLVKTPRDHLCNRYCGGSHTTTTPQQRVMRMGHFLTQWGPEVVQLTEGMVKGTDGKMYKSRRIRDKLDVCGPGYCEDRTEDNRSLDRTPSGTVTSRKLLERRGSNASKKRSMRRASQEGGKDIIEELAEPPATDTEGQESGNEDDEV